MTGVGGTMGDDPKVAASLSGGGSSFYFPRPRYQDNAVSTLLQHLGSEYAGFYKCVCCHDLTRIYT